MSGALSRTVPSKPKSWYMLPNASPIHMTNEARDRKQYKLDAQASGYVTPIEAIHAHRACRKLHSLALRACIESNAAVVNFRDGLEQNLRRRSNGTRTWSRKIIETEIGTYHVITRTRAFLMGDHPVNGLCFDGRRRWLLARLIWRAPRSASEWIRNQRGIGQNRRIGGVSRSTVELLRLVAVG